MSTPAPAAGDDPDRTRPDESGTFPLGAGGLSRGAILAGRYRLEMLLAEGGMGFVWSAYHLELELPVAIKLLRAGPKNERLAQRLRIEARAEARLAHPSIVRVFDIGLTDDGDPFIVMELLVGESLADRLSRGRLSGTEAVKLLLPIADALVVAHANGVVHRDFKPHNVFLAKEGAQLQPKLLDFGIAKLESALFANIARLTNRGTVMGSPSYMSPEQVRGEDVDHRSDIWSFCVTLFRAVTGAMPFRGPNERATLNAIVEQEPAAIPRDVVIEPRLLELMHWGLTKDREKRPPSMRHFGRELARWLVAQGVSVDAAGTPVAGRWLGVEPPLSVAPPVPHRGARPGRSARLTAAAVLVVGLAVAHTDSFRQVGALTPVMGAPEPLLDALAVAAPAPAPAEVVPAPDVVEPAPVEASPVAQSPAVAPPPARSNKTKRAGVRPDPSSRLPF